MLVGVYIGMRKCCEIVCVCVCVCLCICVCECVKKKLKKGNSVVCTIQYSFLIFFNISLSKLLIFLLFTVNIDEF